MSERGEFVQGAEAGTVSVAELCRQFGIGRKTAYPGAPGVGPLSGHRPARVG